MDDDEVDTYLSKKSILLGGVGRELNLFDNTDKTTTTTTTTRPFVQCTNDDAAAHTIPVVGGAQKYRPRVHRTPYEASQSVADVAATNNNLNKDSYFYRMGGGGGRSSSYTAAGERRYSSSPQQKKKKNQSPSSSLLWFQPVTDWWSSHVSPNVKHWPKIQCRIEPTTTLKLRKTFRPLKTIVRLSAHFNTQRGVWQFQSSWEDAIIGGKLTLAGWKELQLTKSWQLSVGPVEDLVTRLRLRAAVDLQTWKAYVRVGFRTERLSPINVMEGFSLVKQVPLDGNNGHVKLEVKANFALPEPEIEYSTETQRSLVGMGDIEVGIEELNLILDF